MVNKYNYLAKNTLLFTISSFGSKLLAFFLVPFYTSVLTTAEYGTVDLITTTSSLLVFVVTLCIADAVLRFAIDASKSRTGVFGFGIRVVLSGSAVMGAILYVLSIFNPFHWESYLYFFLFLTILTNGLNQLIANYLRALDKVPAVAIMGILTTAITIIFNLILLLVLKIGVIGYLVSFVAGYVLSSIYGMIVIHKYDRGAFTEVCDRETRLKMIAFSVPLIFNGVAWWMNSSLDRYFIIYYCGAAVNGLYAVASKIPTVLSMINQIFNQAWNLSAIKEFDKEDKDGFFSRIYSLYNFVLIASCSGLILLNIPLAKILFSKDFFIAWKFSSVLIVTAVFSALSGFFGSIFVAIKNSKVFAVSTVIAAVINIILNWILIPPFGALGGAAATAVSFIVVWLIRYVYATRYIHMQTNMARDVAAYVLVILQVVLEHIEGHCYIGQIAIFIVILIIYNKQITQTLFKVRQVIKKLIKNNAARKQDF